MCCGSFGHVEGVGGGALHAKGQLERLNARLQPPVEARFAVLLVQLPQQIELPPLHGRGGVRAANVLDQLVDLLVLRIDVRALVHARQEPDCQFSESLIGRPLGHMATKPGRF